MAVEIQSVMHVNVNCTILARSLAFYRDALGLVAASHTNPVPQDGGGFGMEGEVQWDAHILQDDRGFAGPGIDLLEWKRPCPTGRPNSACNALGFSRIGFAVPDLDAVHARISTASRKVCPAPTPGWVDSRREGVARVFRGADPDGAIVEVFEQKDLPHPRLDHVVVNVSDLERSREWVERVLGLEPRGTSDPGPRAGAGFGIAGQISWRGASYTTTNAGHDAFALELVEWREPRPTGKPNPVANGLGLYRMAFMVADMKAAHAELLAQGVACPDPVYLDMGPEIPIDGLWAVFFPDPDGACFELIETPKLVG